MGKISQSFLNRHLLTFVVFLAVRTAAATFPIIFLFCSPAVADPADDIVKLFIDYYYTPTDGILREGLHFSNNKELFLRLTQERIRTTYKDAKPEKVEDIKKLLEYLELRVGRRATQEMMFTNLADFSGLTYSKVRARAEVADVKAGEAATNKMLSGSPVEFINWLRKIYDLPVSYPQGVTPTQVAAINAQEKLSFAKMNELLRKVEKEVANLPPNLVATQASKLLIEEYFGDRLEHRGGLALAGTEGPEKKSRTIRRLSVASFVKRAENLYSSGTASKSAALPDKTEPQSWPVLPVLPFNDFPGLQEEALALIKEGTEPNLSEGKRILDGMPELDWSTFHALEEMASNPESSTALKNYCRTTLHNRFPDATRKLMQDVFMARLTNRDRSIGSPQLAQCIKDFQAIAAAVEAARTRP